MGQKVTDSSGRVGILREVIRDWEDPAELPNERKKQTVAFVRPEGGGVEWMTSPARLSPV
ncbi:hypothetical protein [Streptomyces sp. MST-110588]|uniref:hypothetical protein n=1 Tax=Streptomyces sp. MST-110588 TaxID=2833628 RepID=UPI001F5CC328|nr:hypothetical protein [Streptomyces sp. MST-110588]